ncbi:hypothetical protein KP509_02G004800 [Ceratopteris richardii]|uniref:Cytochrome c oxidase subunit 3 n=1 Tax=Ceratopteris richardii TaxID=49495 RepID=A0A8T2V648_CERRI|nr:hypothetical protein KP509_02G004800 [Ceratopteris richardii]
MVFPLEHPYHLVDPSPWPLLGSLGALASTIGAVMYMHSFTGDRALLTLGLGLILYTMFVWWRDVTCESTYEGNHTKAVMFSLAFFWAFLHSSSAPAVEIGAIRPPQGIEVLNPWGIPFLNTLILLLSGAAVTWAHYAILAGSLHHFGFEAAARYRYSVDVVWLFLFASIYWWGGK